MSSIIVKEAARWGNIRVRQDLIDRVVKCMNSAEGKRYGYTNISQYTDHVLRAALAELEDKRFEHVNMYEDHVKILDNHIGHQGRILSVYFSHGSNPVCDYCESDECVHVQYAWEIDGVREILKKHGFKPPLSRI